MSLWTQKMNHMYKLYMYTVNTLHILCWETLLKARKLALQFTHTCVITQLHITAFTTVRISLHLISLLQFIHVYDSYHILWTIHLFTTIHFKFPMGRTASQGHPFEILNQQFSVHTATICLEFLISCSTAHDHSFGTFYQSFTIQSHLFEISNEAFGIKFHLFQTGRSPVQKPCISLIQQNPFVDVFAWELGHTLRRE